MTAIDRVIVLLCAGAMINPAAAASLYAIKDITPAGYASAIAYDINSDGDAVGIASSGSTSALFSPPRRAPTEELQTRRYVPVTGQAGWFLDTELNRIGKCFRVNTTQTGRSRIRCTWGPIR